MKTCRLILLAVISVILLSCEEEPAKLIELSHRRMILENSAEERVPADTIFILQGNGHYTLSEYATDPHWEGYIKVYVKDDNKIIAERTELLDQTDEQLISTTFYITDAKGRTKHFDVRNKRYIGDFPGPQWPD